jgi:excisionase family DNA binding protein
MDTNQNNPVIIEKLLKPSEVASYLNLSKSFTYHLLQIHAIPTVRVGNAVRIRPDDLREFIRQNIHR